MASNADVGFFYQLGIETNIDEVTKQLKGLDSVANKAVAGVTAGLGGLKLFSNQFRDLDVLSRKLQIAPEYIRQIGFEFDALGFSMQDGLGLVDKLATSLKDLEFKGQFNEAFGLAGLQIESGDTPEQLLQKLRKAYAEDPRRFTAFAGDIGLSTAETGFITQSQADFRRNRAFAVEQVGKEDLGLLIQSEKDLNQNLANLTASITHLGDEILKNVDKLIPVIDFLSENLKLVTGALIALKLGGGVAKTVTGGGSKAYLLALLGKLAIPATLGYAAYKLGRFGIDAIGEANLTTEGEKGKRIYDEMRRQSRAKRDELLSQIIISDGSVNPERRRQDLLDAGKTTTNNNNFTFNMMTQDGVDRTMEVINLTMEEE